MKESDLYPPVKRFLESQHYEVKGEVQDCDVLAVRGAEAPVIVELKLSLNLNVILQAVERLSLTQKVYIGIPRKCKNLSRQRRHIIKLLRMLGERQLTSILVEGGSALFGSLFDCGLVDKVLAFVSPVIIGGENATSAVGGHGAHAMAEALRLKRVRVHGFGDDVMISGYLEQ